MSYERSIQFESVRWIAGGILMYLVFLIARPFLTPLGWAAVIAILCHPVHARLEHRWGSGRAALTTTLLVTIIVIVPLAVIATAFVSEMIDALHDLQDAAASGRFTWIERAFDRTTRMIPALDRPDLMSGALDAARRAAVAIVGYSGAIVGNIATFIFEVAFALFALFFLLRDSSSIMRIVRSVTPLDGVARDRLIAQTADVIAVSVRSSVLVAGVQGLLGGCVFAAVGIDAPVFWGVMMAILCLLPLGAWVVWLPAAILLAAGGQFGRAVIVVALGFGIVSAVDNFLRPMLLSGRTPMNGLLVFISLFGGVAAFGALGLVLGPVIVATASASLTTYIEARRGLPPGSDAVSMLRHTTTARRDTLR